MHSCYQYNYACFIPVSLMRILTRTRELISRLPFIFFCGLLVMADSGAADKAIELPSIVGPDLYEIYTDAGLFTTEIRINDHFVKLSNAAGMGRMHLGKHGFSGPTGYHNKLTLNGFLKRGKNRIEVIYKPSSILTKARTAGVLGVFAKEMYLHTVILKGQLKRGGLGLESAKIRQLLSEKKDIEIMLNHKQEKFDVTNALKEVKLNYNLDIGKSHKVLQTTLADCELYNDSSNNFSGTLKLNGKLIREINYTSMRLSDSLHNTLKNGQNIFELTVTKTDGPAEIKLFTRCDLQNQIEKTGIAKEQQHADFGDFFDKRNVLMSSFKFSNKGTFKKTFSYKDNSH